MTNAMGGANLHTPPSIFQHMMGQQNTSQQPGTWMQMPQVPPMSIPWSVPSLQQPELVRFTGGPSFEPVLHQKRKLEACDMRQTKQFITEEKMAAHFKSLHISPNYQQQSSVPSTSTANSQPVTPRELNMELEMDATNVIDADQIKTGPRLILSEELKRIQQEPILPSSLLSKLEKPSMALVLWEPPSKHLRMLPTRDTPTRDTPTRDTPTRDIPTRDTPTPIPIATDNNNNSSDNNNNSDDNNNADINNLNQIPSSSSVFEPMEL